MTGDTASRLAAFHNVTGFIKQDEYLPNRVFAGKWDQYFFFESDRIFSPRFVEVIASFMGAEGASSCCLLNFTRTPILEYQVAASFYFDKMTTASAYDQKLNAGGPAEGWIYYMDRYGCASDHDEWCIYSERDNDVGVVSLRNMGGKRKFETPLKALNASSINALIQDSSSAPVPFSMLTDEWKTGLLKNYSISD